MLATKEEVFDEKLRRLKLFKVPSNIIGIFKSGKIPVTLLSLEVVDELLPIHKKALEMLREISEDYSPYYITESWHGLKVISVLFISPNKKTWESERVEITLGGNHITYSYYEDYFVGKITVGEFSVESEMLWRIN